MADSSSDSHIFAQLQHKASPQKQQELQQRLAQQQLKAQQRQEQLIGLNSSKPVTISSIQLLQAEHTRRAFLERLFNPILSHNQDGPYTLQEALREIGHAVDKLNRFAIFKSPISTFIDQPDQTDASSTPTDLSVFIHAPERSRYTIKTGTEAGSSEGSAFFNVVLRNLFGGAESLNAHASLGTRTRSAYSAYFDTPILSNPDMRLEIGALASSTLKTWASHEELLKGGSTKLKWRTSWGNQHELAYSGLWRQVTGLSEHASPTVRADAGDTFKSSISHTFINDTRDTPMLPSRGYLFKAVGELAGFGPLAGDVAFAKYSAESQLALPIPIPGLAGDSGISFTAGLRGGLLYPLTLAGSDKPAASRINDRFQLGGPTDIRGFRLAGLGPRDGSDAVGGDVYAAGGASLLFPVPGMGKDTPLRFQTFINGGRLLALQNVSSGGEKQASGATNVQQSVEKTLRQLTNDLPSCAAGVGLVYAHPVARFELNFSLPLVLRKGEEGRKGVQFGVGIDFL